MFRNTLQNGCQYSPLIATANGNFFMPNSNHFASTYAVRLDVLESWSKV